MLEELGYLDGDTVTAAGRRLARIYSELDLLAAECLRERLWDGLDSGRARGVPVRAGLRVAQPDDAEAPRCPAGAVRRALAEMVRDLGAS